MPDRGDFLPNFDYDLIIIGGGGSGLTAAARSAQLGVSRILVLEKGEKAGGNSVFPHSVICLNSSRQIEKEEADDVEAIIADTMERLNWAANPYIVRRYLENTGRLTDWLFDIIPEQLYVERASPPGTIPMGSLKPADAGKRLGYELVRVLEERCGDAGVELFKGSPAVSLERLSEGFSVTWERGGIRESAASRCVLISAGGVAGSINSLHRYFPSLYLANEERSSKSMVNCVGDGIELAASAGAETGRGMSIFTGGPVCHADYFVSSVIMNAKCLWLNRLGKRFVNEELGYGATQALMLQPGKMLYAVFDSRTKELIKEELCNDPRFKMRGFNPGDLESRFSLLASGGKKACVAQTLEELDSFAEIDAGTFAAGIECYNGLCTSGYDKDMFKQAQNLIPLTEPPYYMAVADHFHDSTQGGVTIDEWLNVLDCSGRPVKGLYAAGDNAGGFVSPFGYAPMGAGFTWALCSGFLAAESIAGIK